MIALKVGNCVDVLRSKPAPLFGALVTDPPYGFSFMAKWWDYDVPSVETWIAIRERMKPGAYGLIFAGSRTFHRMVVNIEDAGFEIRDVIMWLYGTGFPKSLNVGGGWGTALKPAYEPIALVRNPLAGTVAANVAEFGTGALNIDGCRVGMSDEDRRKIENMGGFGEAGYECKPRIALNLKKPSIQAKAHENGRWPANVILDEVAAEQLGGPSRFFYCPKASRKERDAGLEDLPERSGGELTGRQDGSVGTQNPRAGAGRTSGGRNTHPTVKPVALMRYLVRLITPPGGVVLDPFMGSGSTGIAVVQEGFHFAGIDMSEAYVEIARRRIHHAANR